MTCYMVVFPLEFQVVDVLGYLHLSPGSIIRRIVRLNIYYRSAV